MTSRRPASQHLLVKRALVLAQFAEADLFDFLRQIGGDLALERAAG